MYLILNQMYLI